MTRVKSMDWKDPQEKEMAARSSVLAWEIPWTEEPGGLQSMVTENQTRLSTCSAADNTWCRSRSRTPPSTLRTATQSKLFRFLLRHFLGYINPHHVCTGFFLTRVFDFPSQKGNICFLEKSHNLLISTLSTIILFLLLFQ